MNHLLDFPGKKANLRLALLHGFGGCAMLDLCTYYSPEGSDKYQEIGSFPKPDFP